MADEMKTENRSGAYTKAVGLFVPVDDLATATAGDPESVASKLNRGRGSGQLTSAKLVESFGDTRPVHRTSAGNVGVSDDLPSGTCRETYIRPSRRTSQTVAARTPTPRSIGCGRGIYRARRHRFARIGSRTPFRPSLPANRRPNRELRRRGLPKYGSVLGLEAFLAAPRLGLSHADIFIRHSANSVAKRAKRAGTKPDARGPDVGCVNQRYPVEGAHSVPPLGVLSPGRTVAHRDRELFDLCLETTSIRDQFA
jgi:hypothetical protein